MAFVANARAANYYINASGALGNGSGSSTANAADASTAVKYSAIVQAHSASGTVIEYAPGTYLVNPALPMYNGVTHQGAGIDSTFIKIANGAAAGTWTPMWLAGNSTISSFKFFDATFDFNTVNQPWWTSGTGICMAFAFSTADHCTIQRIKFINIGAKNEESFPIFFITSVSGSGNLNNNLIDSCVFTEPVPSGNTNGGLTCIMMADAEPNTTVDNSNVVSNCQFLNLNAPTYSDIPYAQCCTCPVVTSNTASGVDSLWFIEPGTQTLGDNVYYSGQTVQVTGNTVTNSGAVAAILMHPNGNFAANLNVQNNNVGMTQHPYYLQGPRSPAGVTIETYWSGTSQLGNITVQNNTFTAPLPSVSGSSPRLISANVTAGSGNYYHMASLTVINNAMVNFPQDGNQYNVTTNPAYNPNYTNTGNTFAPPVISGTLAATGTEGWGFSYQIGASNTPAGYGATGLPPGLAVNPSTGWITGTATQTGASQVALSAVNASGTGTATLSLTMISPYSAWRSLYFSAAQLNDPTVSGDTASPAGDGISNLIKYAANQNPWKPAAGVLPKPGTVTVNGTTYMTLTYTQAIAALDITYTPEVSPDLKTWNSGPNYTVVVSASNNADGVTQTVVARDLAPVGSLIERFMRLRLTDAPPATLARNFYLQPFGADSPWNTAISSNATYQPVANIGTCTGDVNYQGKWTTGICEATSTDRVAQLYIHDCTLWNLLSSGSAATAGNSPAVEASLRSASYAQPTFAANYYATSVQSPPGTRTWPNDLQPLLANWTNTIYVPADAESSPDTDAQLAIMQPNGLMLECYDAVICANGDIVCTMASFSDPSSGGSGVNNGRCASLIDNYAGLIRKGEVTTGTIPHALSCTMSPTLMEPSAVWPASTFDMNDGYINQRGPTASRCA